MISLKIPPQALTAEEFEHRGNRFESDIHIIETPDDTVSSEWTQHILNKYGSEVSAYHVGTTFSPDSFVIQLQFPSTPEGRATAQECLAEYRRGFEKGGYVPKKKQALNARKEPGPRKRLYKRRMYRLPDGQSFWYYGLWDRHGNVIGKVEALDRPRASGIPAGKQDRPSFSARTSRTHSKGARAVGIGLRTLAACESTRPMDGRLLRTPTSIPGAVGAHMRTQGD